MLTLVAYGLGLATVSVYLRQLDVTLPDPALLKARFVLTGAVAILVSGLCLGAPLVGDRLSRLYTLDWLVADRHTTSERPTRDRRPAFLFVALLVPQIALTLLLGATHAYGWGDPELLVAAFSVYFAGFVAGLAILLTVLGAIGRITRDLPRWTLLVGLAGLCLVSLCLYVPSFATSVYQHLPQQFGGGHPKRERLVIKHDAIFEAQQLGLHVTGAQLTSQPVEVLFNGNDSRAIEVAGVGVVELSDSLIVGSISAE